MRAACTLLATILIPLASADPLGAGSLGTKTSPAAFDASPMGAGPVVQMLLALALVGAGVKFALPWIVARLGGRIATQTNGTIRIEESAAFPGGRLYVVEARGRTLLLGATAQNVACLADLTANDFAEALEEASRDPRSAIRDEPPLAVPPLTLHSRLARLERLGR